MKKTLLVATDFSPAATNAACYAADMAKAIGSDVLLLHVFQPPVNYTDVPLVLNEVEMKQHADAGLNRLQEELSDRTDKKVNVETIVTMGSFLDELQTVCRVIRPYLVIMGCHGTTASDHLLYGNHAVRALKNLPWPVITVPAGILYAGIRKIGLACDFDNAIDIMPFEEIEMLVRDLRAELHIINMSRSKQFEIKTEFEAGLLQEMLADLKPEFHFIASKRTDEGIIEFVKANHIDLLIVLPKRHSLIDKLIHRSFTRQLVLHSHTPVMALHNRAQQVQFKN